MRGPPHAKPASCQLPAADALTCTTHHRAVFAAGFIVRPIGALVFGHVADEIGRNRSLVASIATIAAATVVIGVLPGARSSCLTGAAHLHTHSGCHQCLGPLLGSMLLLRACC